MASDLTLRGIRKAADLIGKADALLITAGAGIGVDSGLPDFRGTQGFWRAYPALKQRGLGFEQIAQPSWFFREPETAWAFYGHRHQLYRETKPHAGFGILLEWGRSMPAGHFVVTSNADGQFQAAGFDEERLVEVHGNVHVHQCTMRCDQATWRNPPHDLRIDLETMRAQGELPRCPTCGGVARPNVLMFDDSTWVSRPRDHQRARYLQWLATVRGRRVVIVEVGAGLAIPKIRRLGEELVAEGAATLVRINPDASERDDGAIPIRMGALEALRQIHERLRPALTGRPIEAGAARPERRPSNREPATLPKPVAEREMEVVDFFPIEDPPTEMPTWARVLPRHSDLRNTTFIDLVDGTVEPFNYLGITLEDETAVWECWMAKGFFKFPPLPQVRGYVAPGYVVTGRSLFLPGVKTTGRPGAAILHVCDEHHESIITMGMARRPLEAAQLWRVLFEEANTHLTPLDVPQPPWIARRLDRAASQHTAMLPALSEIARVMAWCWMRWQTAWEVRDGGGGA